MLLFFDTETTGKWINGLPIGHPDQPKIVQLAARLCYPNGENAMSMNVVVYQEHVPAEAAKIHGKTTDIVKAIGLGEGVALSLFEEMSAVADTFVAHNGEYDQKVILNAIRKIDGEHFKDPFAKKLAFCTMRSSTAICKIRGPRGWKWPTLTEAHTHFFGKPFEGAHDAMADVDACKAIYFAIQDVIAQTAAQSPREAAA